MCVRADNYVQEIEKFSIIITLNHIKINIKDGHYRSGAPEFTVLFSNKVCAAQSFSIWVVLCVSYFVKNDKKMQKILKGSRRKPPTCHWIIIVLVHWNNSARDTMLLHSDTLFWFRANQYLLLLLNAVCLTEKQQIPIS